MLLRFQHDPKPLEAVISGVLSRHASGGVAQNPDPAEQQQLAGSSQRPAKRAKRGSKEDSPAQIIADDRREAQDASSRQPDAGKRDTVQQQAHSQGASGAAMRALRSIGAGFTGRADESDDELDHDMAAEPSSIQGLLDAIAFKSGTLPYHPLTSAPADYSSLHHGSSVIMRSQGGTNADWRCLTENNMRCPVMTHGSHNKH